MRATIDPYRVGRLEARAWELYYRRRWAALLVTSVRLVRAAFRTSWRRTLLASVIFVRANRAWAPPSPSNDPDAARRYMARFFRLVGAEGDVRRMAELEVGWWRVHREHQHAPGSPNEPLIDALAKLYAYVHSTTPERVRRAAELRAQAMDVSDVWVADGASANDVPVLREIRTLLVRSYAALVAETYAG